MSERQMPVILRLLLIVILFMWYTATAPATTGMTVPFLLLFFVLLQISAYLPVGRLVRLLILGITAVLLFWLGRNHPAHFTVLSTFWFYEWTQRLSLRRMPVAVLFYAAVCTALFFSGRIPRDVGDWCFLMLLIAFMGALRLQREENRKLDQTVLSLTKSTRDLELEQERARLHRDQLRELYTLEERNRISRDLHDSVGHSLSAIRIQLEAIATVAESDGPQAAAMARRLAGFSQEGLQRLRALLQEMKPPRYSDQALVMQLMKTADDFSTMTGLQVHVTASQYLFQTTLAQDRLLSYALQEFLSNAVRHGKASQVNVHLQYTEAGLTLTMKDNGTGTGKFKKNIGLRGIEERTRAENGTVSIQTAPGAGFTVQIHLPKGDHHDTNHHRG